MFDVARRLDELGLDSCKLLAEDGGQSFAASGARTVKALAVAVVAQGPILRLHLVLVVVLLILRFAANPPPPANSAEG